jgi:putative SOS response-associated peptidase YedK
MCNEAARLRALGEIVEAFTQLKIPLTFPEGLPNLPATASIRITDPAAIVRLHDGAHQLVQRRWSWAGSGGKPVYNYRSEGRRFGNSAVPGREQGRCLIPVDGFYEFTAAEPPARRKTKWLFTVDNPEPRALFAIAGLWKTVGPTSEGDSTTEGGAANEAFTMLTCEPGPDIAPYHNRQIVIMPRGSWADWLGGTAPAADLIAPTPGGTLTVTRVA